MGVTVTVTQNGLQEATAKIQGFIERSVDLSMPMKRAAVLMMRSIQANFDNSGRPTTWTPLAQSTLRQKQRLGYSSKPLIRTGALRQSIAPQSSKMSMVLSTAIPYGAIHQYGGFAGRSRGIAKSLKKGVTGRPYIPARPYLVFQNQDLERIKNMIVDYLTGPITNG